MRDAVKILFYVLLLAPAIVLIRCAHPVSPSGGPKDTTPPVFLGAEPPQNSTYFHSNTVKLFFDEYIQLKDISKNLIVSPPVSQMPEVKIKKKSVVVEFKEPLLENTTYNLYFGEAIADVNEGNALKNFRYVFSTGPVIDSMSVRGYVYDAFTLKPVEGAAVMLYLDNNDTIPYDSLPFFVRPYYLTRTDNAGNFELKNLRNEPFKLFALVDENSNLIYDQPTEMIGFVDSLIYPEYVPEALLPDTVLRDTVLIDTVTKQDIISTDTIEYITTVKKDTVIAIDTISPDTALAGVPGFFRYQIGMFLQTDSIQKFLKAEVPRPGEVDFIFKRPAVDPAVVPLNNSGNVDCGVTLQGVEGDTLFCWLPPPVPDSLIASIMENGSILDTVELSLKSKSKPGRKPRKESVEVVRLKAKVNVKGVIRPDQPLILSFDYPVKKYDFSNAILYGGEDSLNPQIKPADSLHRIFKLFFNWKEATAYNLIIPDSSLFDIQNHTNDTILISFKTKELKEYGSLIMNVTVNDTAIDYIVELIIDNKMVKKNIIRENTELKFEYLTPGSYIFKVIFDENRNGKWDAGNYIYGIQPERVRIFEKDLTIRANWDLKESIELE